MDSTAAPRPLRSAAQPQGVGAELRESVLLLGLSLAVTIGVAAVAQAAFALLG